ncbi:PilZ domain-containing protein [Mesorhizobium sp. B2-3-14]|uniref:PilZ domain-containing protein n=1 Tax=unclassified Mesorhizobium TaxID=325217 RepID=UPI00112C7E70|nr:MULTISPECIES: PilZ domain-containing protein [unclassified Mesorhizobium]MBZ9932870.1 PilZ domain-containing protein [Mesorhizobium sp. BR1-1-5]MBZ9904667.1 PilZ domain-containing protein [Mesorhizobium sp. BR115XR7A]MBZ9974471.1 PilZ domain-containing protein [Mesorhizobium sp. BR-1-1-10]TPK75881.1 PilZ domain-containing protein [Mesorhizobium sp. B2-4-18]TPL85496.1 PilZ domain-containing protein [Mesorhizobium sp. B2-3-14]
MANPADPLQHDPGEPQREHRPRVLKGGTVITGIQNSEVACMVRNQHAGGAELKLPAEARVPDHFLLYIPLDGVAYRCEVRWRRSDRIGVQFNGTEPKPKLHYG